MEGGMMETLFNTNVVAVAVRLQRLRPQSMSIRLIGALRLFIDVCLCVCPVTGTSLPPIQLLLLR